MATLQELERALVNADRAGDLESAQVLAREVARLRGIKPGPMQAAGAIASGVNKGVTMLAGLPADTVANVIDLGIAGYGAAKGALGGTNLPSPLDRSKLPLTSNWIQDQIRRSQVGRNAIDAGAQDFPALHAGGAALAGALVPGAVPRNMMQGAVAFGPGEAMRNAGQAFASGVAGQKATEVTGSPEAGLLAATAPFLPGAITRAPRMNPVGEATLRAGQEAGYVVPPSQAGRSSILEGVAGKIKTAQRASARNQEITNRLAARELGLPENTPLTPELLKDIRRRASAAYEDVILSGGRIRTDDQYINDLSRLSRRADQIRKDFPDAKLPALDEIEKLADGLVRQDFSAMSAVEYIKTLRAGANAHLSWQNQADPNKRALGLAQRAAADALESVIERNLAQQGKAQLVEDYRRARVLIAKTYTVENALNEATGNVSARQLVKESDRLSGNLKAAARFAEAFPKANQSIEGFGGTPSVSPLDAYGSAGLGIVGAGSFGVPTGVAAAGIPLLRNMAGPAVLSGPMQRSMTSGPRQLTWEEILRISQAMQASR